MTLTVKRLAILVATLLLALLTLLPNPLVFSQESAGSGLRISPTRTQISVVPGDNYEVLHSVKNVTNNPVTIQPGLNDFESDGVSGEPKLIGDPEQISKYSLREFITLPDDFDLQPDEEKEVTILVQVPENAAPGAYFGSVLYRAVPQGSTNDGQVALVASVGSLILLEVPGQITERIEVKSVSAYLNNKQGSFFTKKPDQVGILIENLGNGFSQPYGKVLVKDWRGNNILEYELNDTTPRGNILPESSRLFLDELANVETKTVNGEEVTTTTSPLTWPGRYSIVANISHGSTGEIFTVSTTFWYVPIWLVVTVIVLIVLLIVGAVMMYRRYVTRKTHRKKQ